jgi:LmbE family N-acetylglucosaminyl deacetylase
LSLDAVEKSTDGLGGKRRTMEGIDALLGRRRALKVLCLGAHCDDIEIGCGATLMRLAGERALDVTWVVLSSTPPRVVEAKASATRFLRTARKSELRIESLRDGYLPAHWAQAKDIIESLKRLPRPDLIFTHERDDRHQDHRVVSELTWNTFRDHTILEYEIPKYDGGLGQPNLYVPVTPAIADRKVKYLQSAYASQRNKGWFTEDAFLALMRMRGIECNAARGLAEAFHARKLVL